MRNRTNRSEHDTGCRIPGSGIRRICHSHVSCVSTWRCVTLSTLSSRARGPPGAPATAVVVFGVFGSGPLPFVPATSGLRPGTGGARSGTAGRAAAARAARPASPSQQHVAPWAVVPACCDRTARHTVTARPARGAHNAGNGPAPAAGRISSDHVRRRNTIRFSGRSGLARDFRRADPHRCGSPHTRAGAHSASNHAMRHHGARLTSTTTC